MGNKLGRNELCYCGSGKKYKKCCKDTEVFSTLSAIAATDTKWYQLRCTEGSVIDDHLLPYVKRQLSSDVIKSAYEVFLQNEKLPKGADGDEMFERLFLPWCLFNWIPNADFGIEDFDGQATLAENYLKSHRNKLTSKERLFIEAMVHTYYSFYCVLDMELDKSLTVKDVLLKTTHILKERQGTRQLEKGDVVYGRILTMDGQSIFVGMAPFRFKPEYVHKLIDLRKLLVKENGGEALTGKTLRGDSDFILSCFFAFLISMFNTKLPTVMNTDEELVVLTKSYFKLMTDPEDALSCLLPLTLGADLNYLLEVAERDEFGKVTKVEFSWMKEGNKKHKTWTNTILGHVFIEEDQLTLDTNSVERAALGRKLLEEYLGDKISFLSASANTPEQMMKSSKKSNHRKDDGAIEAYEPPPEVKEAIKGMAEAHWKSWFDEPIPLLQDKTPRQAVKTKEGRERLEALLMDYERCDKNKDEDDPFKVNIEYLRNELHLEMDDQ
ncbi:hypothetical protein FACS189472_08400 [Alphaproteobacteria bacterium]|nr:hypothetical protein FACS189472_08400 [Alphaproteobacteria bacterium]